MSSYNPWHDLQRVGLVAERIAFEIDSDDIAWIEGDYVALNRDCRRTQLRCSLAHEIAHRDLGHLHVDVDERRSSADRLIATRHELQADELAAVRLVTRSDLARALLVWGADHAAAAEELNVDVATWRVRLQTAWKRPSERGFVRNVLATREGAA